MYERILFPTDGSEGAAAVFDHAVDLAATHGATLHVLNVADTGRDSVTRVGDEVVDALVREGERVVDDLADRARDRNVDVVTEVLQGRPYETIVDYATDRDVDLVAMPTHGRTGLRRLLLGSVTERVVRQSEVPVLTMQPDGVDELRYPYRRVLVPTDGSECAAAALDVGVDVATTHDAALDVLSVVDVASLGVDVRAELQLDFLEDTAERMVAEATGTATDAGVGDVSGAVEYGSSVHRAILSYVDEHDVDVVVVGTHGRTGFDRYLLGSVAEKLVRTSPVPVLTVRDSDAGEEGA